MAMGLNLPPIILLNLSVIHGFNIQNIYYEGENQSGTKKHQKYCDESNLDSVRDDGGWVIKSPWQILQLRSDSLPNFNITNFMETLSTYSNSLQEKILRELTGE